MYKNKKKNTKKKGGSERVWKKTYTIFISTALGIKAQGSRKKLH